jgi:predicted site-specific integrase-resolvase
VEDRRVNYPPVLSAEDIAELLIMNIDTVRRLSRDGIIPCHRVPGGRAFKYLFDEVIEWVRGLPGGDAGVD